jgi:hypothetical protein
VVARGSVQLPTFALGVRIQAFSGVQHIASMCRENPHEHWLL